jgi:outer membrane protein assembly factor BamB
MILSGINITGKIRAGALNAALLTHTLDNPTAYGTSFNDSFGSSVGISGNRVIVGAIYEDDAGGNTSGKAYIFDVTTGAQIHTLDDPNAYGTTAGDQFGCSVAIDGNRVIVGAQYEDDAGGNSSGKAYIFDVTTGALLHTLDNPSAYGTAAGDAFGRSVGISGNRVIVSARDEDDAGGTNSGKAYIFDVTTGALVFTIDNPNAYGTTAYDQFGSSVGISGNRVIVGAHYEDDAGGADSGKAYIFDVTTGALLHTLDNPSAYGTSVNDYFGFSVGISGNRVIVGAYTEDDATGINSGKAYIFDVTTGALLHTLNNPNAYGTTANDWFGISTTIGENYAIVCAQYEDDAGGTESGKAYIFDVTTGALVFTIDNPNAYGTSFNDSFGCSVAIDGNRVIVGAQYEDDAGGTNSGKAYIFQISTGLL